MTKQNRIAVTGGSGHLGTALIIKLLDLGYIIKAQFNSYTPPITHANLSWIKGGITDSKAISDLVSECDIVVHCAGLISLGDKTHDEIYAVNVKGTETVIKACQLHPEIRLIHISSSNAVKEFSANGIFTENQPYKTASDFSYPYTKALAEQKVLEAVNSHDLNAIVVRPTSIVGPPDYKPSLMGQTILDFSVKKYPTLTTGGYNIVDVRDLAQTIINGFKLGEKGEVFLLSGTDVSIKQLAKMANPSYNPILIRLGFLLGLMPVIDVYRKIFGLQIPISKESLTTLKNAPKKMDCSKAKSILKHNPRPTSETVIDLVQWFNHKTK